MATNRVVFRGERRPLRKPAVRAARSSMTRTEIGAAAPRSTLVASRSQPSDDRLRHELERLRAVVDAVQTAACVVGASGQILHANEIAKGLLSPRGASLRTSRHARWDLTPLRVGARGVGFLAICRSQADESRTGGAVPSAILRWGLTARQGRVLELVGRGLTNAAIAEQLRIGVGTVEFHVSAIFDKAGVQNRASLVAKMSDM